MNGDAGFRAFTVASLGYHTPLLTRTSTIEELATRLLRDLKDKGIFEKYREIYFIAHSMGGLLVKRMLVDLNRPKEVATLRQVKAVLYISTPAQGANMAELGSWLSINPQLQDMRPADLNSFLQSLKNQWQNLMRDRGAEQFPRSFCAYETKPTFGRIIVNRIYAATSCDQNAVGIEENHFDMVKPDSIDAFVYSWTAARIRESSLLAEDAPGPQYDLWKTHYNYKEGLIVEGVEWKEDYHEYQFSVRNPSKTENIVDLRLRYQLPWPIVSSRLHHQQGCEGLAFAGTDSNTVKVGNQRQVNQLVIYRTNVLEINAQKIFPEGVFHGKLVVNTAGQRAKYPEVGVSYRDGTGKTKNSFSYKIRVDGNAGTANVIESTPMKEGEGKMSVVMEFVEPFQLKGGK